MYKMMNKNFPYEHENHEGHKDYKCEYCGKSFSEARTLKKQYIHIIHEDRIDHKYYFSRGKFEESQVHSS